MVYKARLNPKNSLTMAVTPKSSAKTLAGAMETKSRLEMCWKVDIKRELYPKAISEVTISLYSSNSIPMSL